MNSVTDFDIRKAFAFFCYMKLPNLYLDGYWEHYMKIFNMEQKYLQFMENYKSDGFSSYKDFIDKFYEVVDKGAKTFLKKTLYETVDILKEESKKVDDDWIPKYISPESGNIVKIDIHCAAEVMLKRLDLFNDNYNSGYDIINEVSKYETFKNSKKTRICIFKQAGLHENEYLFSLISNGLLKEIYNSENPIIKNLNKTYSVFKTKCDALIYITGNDDNDKISGEYKCGDMDYHIDCFDINCIEIMGKKYPDIWNNHDHIGTHAIYPMLTPITNAMLRRRTPDEKDLAIGYEDQIFFHLNKDDYKIII